MLWIKVNIQDVMVNNASDILSMCCRVKVGIHFPKANHESQQEHIIVEPRLLPYWWAC